MYRNIENSLYTVTVHVLADDVSEFAAVVYLGRLKMTDMKMTDQVAGHENAGRENAGHEIARDEYGGQTTEK